MEEEIWRDIPEYKGLYQVSSLGNVRSLRKNGKLLAKGLGKVGYLTVALCRNGIAKSFAVHTLVALVFKEHIPNGFRLVCNHINLNKEDNRAVNLEIITNRENTNKKHVITTSIYTGVHWCKTYGKWRSSIYINRTRKHLGYYNSEYDAHLSYEKELIKI